MTGVANVEMELDAAVISELVALCVEAVVVLVAVIFCAGGGGCGVALVSKVLVL